jgi:1-acyl-sn-glycerol-3-phosphate acyltransferase
MAMLIFCRRIIINKPGLLKKKGPLLLACNHPNSFLDAAILADLFEEPVYSLARGDVFKKPFYRRILKALKMFPVYRTSEGVENLGINYETFDECKNIFKKNGVVLIFSEAKCVNEWHLRPLRKGTARLSFSSWSERTLQGSPVGPLEEENTPLEVLPVGINYSSFRRFSKNVFINFGEVMTKDDFDLNEPDGKKNLAFNLKLKEQLHQLVFEISKTDIQKQKQVLEKKPSPFAKIFLFMPAVIGWLVHAPLYIPIKKFTYKKTVNNDHYDSILVALLLFIYPFYLILITITTALLTENFYFLLLAVALPFTAWAYVQLKPQLDKQPRHD